MPHMVIANRLSNGRVVFLATDGQWVESIDLGGLWDPAESALVLEQARQDERTSVVVEPSVIDVRVVGGQRKPTEIREAIRAFGPTVENGRPSAEH